MIDKYICKYMYLYICLFTYNNSHTNVHLYSLEDIFEINNEITQKMKILSLITPKINKNNDFIQQLVSSASAP